MYFINDNYLKLGIFWLVLIYFADTELDNTIAIYYYYFIQTQVYRIYAGFFALLEEMFK